MYATPGVVLMASRCFGSGRRQSVKASRRACAQVGCFERSSKQLTCAQARRLAFTDSDRAYLYTSLDQLFQQILLSLEG